MTSNINNVPTDYLLAMYLEYTFQDKRLLTINQETLAVITEDLTERFPEMNLTAEDVKSAWICWIDEAAHNGCAISPHLNITGEQPWQHKELEVIDQFIKVATEAINNIPCDNKANNNVDYIKNATVCLEHLVAVANSDVDHDISIKIDDKEYQLYDLAALVSSLADAVNYFIEEIS